MIWIGLILGIAIGATGYWAYDKYFGAAKAEAARIKRVLP